MQHPGISQPAKGDLPAKQACAYAGFAVGHRALSRLNRPAPRAAINKKATQYSAASFPLPKMGVKVGR